MREAALCNSSQHGPGFGNYACPLKNSCVTSVNMERELTSLSLLSCQDMWDLSHLQLPGGRDLADTQEVLSTGPGLMTAGAWYCASVNLTHPAHCNIPSPALRLVEAGEPGGRLQMKTWEIPCQSLGALAKLWSLGFTGSSPLPFPSLSIHLFSPAVSC